MTTADRAAVARGRSLFDWGVLPPNAERRPSPYPQRGRVANVSQTTNAREGEYSTYAPPGEKCNKCHKPFKSLETCRRVAVDRTSGSPALGPYIHHECAA